jgi:hypothetical protein
MNKDEFHRFLLRNDEPQIERDKHGFLTIHQLMTYDSGFLERLAFTILSKTEKVWMANGMEVAWLVDPLRGTASIYR